MSEIFTQKPLQEEDSTDKQGSIGHSGDLGMEYPVRNFDNTPLDSIQGRLRTPKSPRDLERNPRLKPTRRQTLFGGILAATLMTGIGTGVVIANRGGEDVIPDDTNNSAEQFPEAPVVEAPVAEDPEVVSPVVDVVDLPSELTAETLQNLSAEQITETFEIKSSEITTPAEFAQAFVDRQEARSNAGGTRDEWLPYQNSGKGDYSSAMIDKYHEATSTGLFGYVSNSDAETIIMDRYDVSFLANKDYHYSIDLVEDSITSTERSDGSYDLTFTLHATDNLDIKDLIGDRDGTDPVDTTERWTFTNIHPNEDGVLRADDISFDKLS